MSQSMGDTLEGVRTKPVFLLALAALAPVANAWNATGHKQIADMAWCLLDRHTREAIAKIMLSGDTVHGRDGDISFVPLAPTGTIATLYLETQVRPKFDLAATWPDQIKGGRSELFEAKINADNDASPGVKPPKGDPLRARGEETRCKTWHYYDLPIFDANPPHPARPSNADRALTLVAADFQKLARAQSADTRAEVYDLYWIEHLVGDLHQPLHCSSNFAIADNGDAGGNEFRLAGGNLHSFWDSGIDHAIAADPAITDRRQTALVSRAWLADKAVRPTPVQIADLKPIDWITLGAQIAETQLYTAIEPGTAPDGTYRAMQDQVCKRQAVLAAYRLARLLKQSLK
jgi:hypothetical protein